MHDANMISLHLGCGSRFIPGFVHIDKADFPHIDYNHNIQHLPMFADNSVDLVYSSHALEYFDRLEAKEVLEEWHRILRPKGILRLAVPDFEALVKTYKTYGRVEKILGPLYGRMTIQTPEGEQPIYHKTVYDFVSLKELLEQAGFTNVRRYDWKVTVHKNYDDFSQAYIPHMEKESGLLISLNVESEKAWNISTK